MKLSISAAARRAGVERKVLYRKIEKGEISKEVGEDGKPAIDLSELVRIYPDAAHDRPEIAHARLGRDNTPLFHDLITILKQDKARLEAEILQAKVEAREAGERERAAIEREREERAKLVGTIENMTRMLTDQRTPARRKWFSWR